MLLLPWLSLLLQLLQRVTALLRLLQLGSAALPVGGYSFSQGLEYAVEIGWISSLDSCEDWLSLGLRDGVGGLDLPVASRLYRALEDGDRDAFQYWNDFALAARESRELLMADEAMGQALLRLLRQLPQPLPDTASGMQASFLGAFVATAWQWQISESACQIGLAWCWLEAQIAAATKLIPLGQTQAQQLLGRMQTALPPVIAHAASLDDDALGATLPGLAMASALHETQYCRLFRS